MPKNIEALRARLAEVETTNHQAFITRLSETHKLPADAVKAIDKAFKTGGAQAVALSDAIDTAVVALTEDTVPDEFGKVDLSESVVLTRQELRDMLATVAAAPRTDVQLSDTHVVDGVKPGDNTVSLNEELAKLSPEAAVARVRELEAAGKL